MVAMSNDEMFCVMMFRRQPITGLSKIVPYDVTTNQEREFFKEWRANTFSMLPAGGERENAVISYYKTLRGCC